MVLLMALQASDNYSNNNNELKMNSTGFKAGAGLAGEGNLLEIILNSNDLKAKG